MNAYRRKTLGELIEKVGEYTTALDILADEFEAVPSDEEDAADNLPESLEERRAQMEKYVEIFNGAAESVREAVTSLEQGTSDLEQFDGVT